MVAGLINSSKQYNNNNISQMQRNEVLDCPICTEQLKSDQCMIDCAAGHVLHYECLINGRKLGIETCPLDRQIVTKCLHDGMVKTLPKPIKKQPQPSQLVYVEYEETPCYICQCNTRDDLQFDEVVVCSGCESVFVHAECHERVNSRRFNYGVMWFCPACRADRLGSTVRRTRRPRNNRGTTN